MCMKHFFTIPVAVLTLFFSQALHAQRQVISFNNDWQFRKTVVEKNAAQADTGWNEVQLPHTWNNKDMQAGKDFYQGEALYRKTFVAEKDWQNRRVFIRFDGVGQVAAVWVNGKLAGEHKGGYSAFCFDISYLLKFGENNQVEVKVNNEARPDVIPVNNNLFALYGGIYRPVNLILTGKLNISTTDYAGPGVYIRQKNVSASSAAITVSTRLENKTGQPAALTLSATVSDAAGKIVQSTARPIRLLPQAMQQFDQPITVSSPHLWNGLDNAYLYKVTVQLKQVDTVLDEVTQPLGLRTIEIRDGKGLYLNNKPYRLYGVCRHQDWWGLGNALTNQQHATDLEMIHEMGANSIRLAHYQQAAYIYEKTDSIGFLVWAEVPFVNSVTGKESDNALQQMKELIRQNFNHPSIYVWGMHNEVYEKNGAGYVSQLTAALHSLAKTEDLDRFTASVNGYGTMERPENGEGDIQGMNRYYGWYEGKTADLEKWVAGLEQKYPSNKIVLSEYGAEGNVQQQDENPPVKIDPVSGQYFPEQLETRLHEVQWGILKKHPYLVSSYVWNMFDFCVPLWNRGGVAARNMKGLVSFDRQIKKDAFYWYKANWSKEPVLYIADRRLVQRKQAVTTITVYSNRGVPVLELNGKKIAAPKQGTTTVHYLFEQVTLQKGRNEIKVSVQQNGKTYSDAVQWQLQ